MTMDEAFAYMHNELNRLGFRVVVKWSGRRDTDYTDGDVKTVLRHSVHKDNNDKEWHYVGWEMVYKGISLHQVYRNNGTSDDKSIRVAVCGWLGCNGTCRRDMSIKIPITQTPKTITKKIEKVIEMYRGYDNTQAMNKYIEFEKNSKFNTDVEVFTNITPEEAKMKQIEMKQRFGVELYDWERDCLNSLNK